MITTNVGLLSSSEKMKLKFHHHQPHQTSNPSTGCWLTIQAQYEIFNALRAVCDNIPLFKTEVAKAIGIL